jgi:hypothetical protein
LGACDKVKQVVPGGKDEPKVTEAAFQLGEVRAIDAQNRADSGAKATAEAAKVTALINSFYSSAFLDPAKWQGGKHPDLAALFTAEAQPGLAANLGNLAMSDLSDKIKSVESKRQTLDTVTFYVDDDGSLPIGVASVIFEAVGKPSGKGKDVNIKHQAHYWLQRDGDGYKISAFQDALQVLEGPTV